VIASLARSAYPRFARIYTEFRRTATQKTLSLPQEMASFPKTNPKKINPACKKMGSFGNFCFFRTSRSLSGHQRLKTGVAPIRVVAEATLAALCGICHIRRAP